ncbi:hypothetical protein Cp4441_02908 [Clostridium perfringens]|nr:hypothetical protein [Clostridium perfringens]
MLKNDVINRLEARRKVSKEIIICTDLADYVTDYDCINLYDNFIEVLSSDRCDGNSVDFNINDILYYKSIKKII